MEAAEEKTHVEKPRELIFKKLILSNVRVIQIICGIIQKIVGSYWCKLLLLLLCNNHNESILW